MLHAIAGSSSFPFWTDLALRSTVILAVAAVAALAMRRASAAQRHLLWCAAAGALLLLPAVRWSAPRLALPVLPSGAPAPAAAAPSPEGALEPRSGASTGLGDPRGADRAAAAPAVFEPSSGPSPGPAAEPLATAAPGAGARLPWLELLWAAGALAVLARILAGLFGARRLARESREVADPRVPRLVGELTRRLGVRARVRVLSGAGVRVPSTWGFARPIVFLTDEHPQWRTERLRSVLAHELAHVARRDCVTQLVVQLACAAWWFHPLVWIAARRARLERERACDDRVLAGGAVASTYAQDLLDLVRAARPARGRDATLAMGARAELESRLRAILDADLERRPAGRRAVAGSLALALAVLVAAAALEPTARARDGAPARPAAADETAERPASLAHAIDAIVREELVQRGVAEAIVGVVDAKGLVLHRAVAAGDGTPSLTARTPIRLGDASKLFTAALLLGMRDRGLLRLDDAVAACLPEEVAMPADPRGAPRITLRHLATHASGLANFPPDLVVDDAGRRDPYGDEALLEALGTARLAVPIGSGFRYSNQGYALLAVALERVGGRPYGTLLREVLLDPLAMDDTFLGPAPGGPGAAEAPVLAAADDVFAPAFDARTTLSDLARFVAMHLRAGREDASPLSSGSLVELVTAQRLADPDWSFAAAIGWLVAPDERLGSVVWAGHTGEGHAVAVQLSLADRLGVIVLAPEHASLLEAANRVLRRSVEDLSTRGEAEACFSSGDWEGSSRAFAALIESEPDEGGYWFQYGFARHQLADYEEAIEAFRRAAHLGYRPAISAYNVACGHALSGEPERALAQLEVAFRSGFRGESAREVVASDEDLDSLRGDPRFERLLTRWL